MVRSSAIENKYPRSCITDIKNLHSKSSIIVGGVDEAGRGSIIGPLVVAGVSIRKSELIALKKMGVRDSKSLTAKARAGLFGEIMDAVESVCVRKVGPAEVDDYVKLHGLNKLEARVMANIIDHIGAEEVYVDCCDVNTARYRRTVGQYLARTPRRIHSLHHADSINAAVSAASIIAKVTRDREIQEIRDRYGQEIGSGYPSDETTMDFIKSWVDANGAPPEFARRSWKPLRMMLERRAQCTLWP